MNYKELYKDKDFGQILFDEDIKNYTTFGIGGKADIMVKPTSMDELRDVLKFNYENKIETFVMGRGSNLLVSDKGIRGCVILLADNFDQVEVRGDILTSLAGSPLGKAARVAIDNSLSGMEEISGIPGSVGGACAMNAGAYGGEIKDIAIKIEAFDYQGNLHEFSNEQMHFDYRHSRIFEENLIVARASFKLREGDKDEILEKFNDYTERRTTKQPLDRKSAGSTFKRPEGSFASKLIDECGLRAYRIGDCQVSEKHCGFIINVDKASCADMIDFINKVSDIVYEKTGFKLEREVKLVGDFS